MTRHPIAIQALLENGVRIVSVGKLSTQVTDRRNVSQGVRRYYESLDDWLQTHPLGWFVVATTVTGFGVAVAQSLLSPGSLVEALPFGLLFGLTFATLTTLFR